MNLGFCIPRIRIFLFLKYICMKSCQNFHKNVIFFCNTRLCSPQLYIQMKQSLACWYCCKYFQLEIRGGEKTDFWLLISFLYHVQIQLLFYGFNVMPAEQSHACGSTCQNISRKLAHDTAWQRYFKCCTRLTHSLPHRLWKWR